MQFVSPDVIRDLSQTHVIYSGAASGLTAHAPVVQVPVITWLPYYVTVTATTRPRELVAVRVDEVRVVVGSCHGRERRRFGVSCRF